MAVRVERLTDGDHAPSLKRCSPSVLGPVELRRGGTVLPVPAGKTTELLIRLALDPGAPVSTDRLVHELWGAAALPLSATPFLNQGDIMSTAIPDFPVADLGGAVGSAA
jgi:hypothetical protein